MRKYNFKVGDKVRVKDSERDLVLEVNGLERGLIYTVTKVFRWGEGTIGVEGGGNRQEVFSDRFELVEAAPTDKSPITSWDIIPWEEDEDETWESLLEKVRYLDNEVSCYIQIAEMRKQHINELEEENAHLKEELWTVACGDNYGE